MSLPEILHRVGEQLDRLISRLSFHSWQDFEVPDGPLPVLPSRPELALTVPTKLRDTWVATALQARQGAFHFLGVAWPEAPPGTKWHLDPTSGLAWPRDEYCYSIPYRHSADLGDVKYVWELNRLQYLQPIAALAACDGDSELQDYCLSELEDWIDSNPPFKGVNWASGIELSLRIVSFIVVLTFVQTSKISPELRKKVRSCLNAHGYWLMRYPSRFSSANNHLIAEAAGLFLLGTLCPDLPGATRYQVYGRHTLEAEIEKQIFPDGVGAEQSPTYEAFVLEFYLLCSHVADQVGAPFDDVVKERMAAAGDFLCWMTDQSGAQPRIGDDDEGRVIYSCMDAEEGYVSSVLGAVSSFLDKPDVAPPHYVPQLRNVVFGTAKCREAGPSGTKHFSHGGYTISRSNAACRESQFVMDHGPLGYLSLAAHGHADTLAVWLHVDGIPVLSDGGTYLYHAGGEWRDYFRSSRAHNTLCVDGVDSSCRATAFAWSHRAEAHVRRFEDDGDLTWLVEAAHDGYVKKFGVKHIRRVSQSQSGIYCIEDWLEGVRGHAIDVEIGFNTHPDVMLTETDNKWNFMNNGRLLLSLTGGDPLVATVVQGNSAPIDGWCSPRFGTRRATNRLIFRGAIGCNEPISFQLEVG